MPAKIEESDEEEEMDLSEDSETVDTEEDDDDEGEEDEDEEEQLEPKVLPNRSSRALRLNKLLEEEDSADEEFWNQEFFAEETKDAEFEASESEQEDVPDSDFSESKRGRRAQEDEDDEDEDEVEAQIRREERSRKKTLKPPGAAGARKPPPDRPSSSAKPLAAAPLSPRTQAAIKAAQEAETAELFKAPTLRKSTRQRVEEAEKERERMEQTKPKKRRYEQQYRPLTQRELLAEAAQTEIENLRSLEALQAAEEEVKKKAAVIRARHTGPYIHYHSKAVNGEALVTCEVANMLLPANMRRQVAPPPRQREVCIVTGQPARYKDPLTLQPYSDSAAFLALRHHFASRQQYAPEPLEPHVLNRSQRRQTGAGRALGSIDLQNME